MIDKKLDPDELFLSKDYVRGVLLLIIKRWQNNGTNTAFIVGLKAFRWALGRTPDEIFKTFWRQILMLMNDLMMENAKAQAKTLGEKWVNVLEKLPTRIEKGDFDIESNH